MQWHFNKIELYQDMQTENPFNQSLNSAEYGINTTIGREVIQNAIDARLDPKKPVKVVFSWKDYQNTEFFYEYLDGLTKRLEKMDGGIRIEDKDYKSNPSFLIIEDFNTRGLTGKFDATAKEEKERRLKNNEKNNYLSYVFKLGTSEKKGTEGGRRGTGRSVLNIASHLRTQFILSKRSDDNEKIFLGLCLGKSHFLDNEDSEFKGTGYFCELNDNKIQPILDTGSIENLAKNVDITRNNENGTSFIVPYPIKRIQPTSILTKCLESYFTVINDGQLELEFNFSSSSEVINSKNLKEQLAKYNLKTEIEFLEFMNNCKNLKDNEIITLRDEAAEDGIIDRNDFLNPEIEIPKLRSAYLNNKPIGIKVPVTIRQRDKEIQKSYFKAYISKTLMNEGKVMFVRGSMVLIGEGNKNFPKNCFGYFHAEQDSIEKLIADSEGVNHTVIEPEHSTILEEYEDGTNMQLITMKKALPSIASLIQNPDEEDDTTTLANFFPVNEGANIFSTQSEDDYDEESEEDEVDNTPDDKKGKDYNKHLAKLNGIEPTLKCDRINSDTGFRVTANKSKKSISEFFPRRVKVVVGYSSPGSTNSTKYHESLDFNFSNSSEISFKLEGVKILQKQKNILEFEAENEDFIVEITNFFTEYGLDINIV